MAKLDLEPVAPTPPPALDLEPVEAPAAAPEPARAVQAAPQVELDLEPLGDAPAPPGGSITDKIMGGYHEQAPAIDSTLRGIPTAADIEASPVGTAMKYLGKPLNFAAGRVASVVPGAKAKLNPNGDWFPDITYSDLIDYIYPEPEKVKEYILSHGVNPKIAEAVRMAYVGAKFNTGLVANFALDPLNALSVGVGTLTKEAQALRKTGDLVSKAANERNLISTTIPLTGREVAVKAAPVMNQVAKAGQTLNQYPKAKKALTTATGAAAGGLVAGPAGAIVGAAGGYHADLVAETAVKLVRAFDYRTGNPEIDLAASSHGGYLRGDERALLENFIQPAFGKRYSAAETQLIGSVVESTPNLRPDNLGDGVASLYSPEFKGTIRAVHGSPEKNLKAFKDPADVDPNLRYDGGGGSTFGHHTYFDETGDWVAADGAIASGGRGISASHVYGADVTFEKALIVTPKTLPKVRQMIGDGLSPHDAMEKLKALGYDGIIVRGMDEKYRTMSRALEKKYGPTDWQTQQSWSEAKQKAFYADWDHGIKNIEAETGLKDILSWQDQVVHFAPQKGAKIVGSWAAPPTMAKVKAFQNVKGAPRQPSPVRKDVRLGRTEAEVRERVAKQIQYQAKKSGLTLAPGRLDDLVEGAMSIKRENMADIAERLDAGILQTETLGEKVIKNYLAHQISPQAKAARLNPKKAAAIEEAFQMQRLQNLTRGKFVSGADKGRHARKIRTNLEEANSILREKTGIKDFFVTDPFLATALKRMDTRKMLRDRELLSVIAKHGVPQSMAKGPNYVGWRKIDHPEFRGKTLMIQEGKGFRTEKADDLLFPEEIADKISYYILPRRIGNISAAIDSYNRIFRGFALAKPDYYIQNWGENWMKNFVQGVKQEDYVDAMAVIGDSDRLIRVNGKLVPARQVKAEMDRLGVITGGQFREGVRGLLYTAKKISREETLAGRARAKTGDFAKRMVEGLRAFGERGENYTRVALYLNRVKQGYKPEVAAFEVEKFLFDFSRNSRATDFARRFYSPFIQAAVKTAIIAPEMIATRPGAYSFFQNNLLKTLENAMNDPVTNWAVQEILPGYQHLQDRIAGQLLPGNHWLFGISAKDEQGQPLPTAVTLGLPVGMDILNQFMVFDGRILNNVKSAGPIPQAITALLTGNDAFTGQPIDIAKDYPEAARRVTYAVSQMVESAIAMPNLWKGIKQRLGIGDPQYFEPKTALAMNGMLGKFGRVTNLEKEYMFRLFALTRTRKELVKTLMSTAGKEFRGKTPDLAMSKVPGGRAFTAPFSKAFSSAEVYELLAQNGAQMQKLQAARGVLSGQVSSAEVASLIQNLDKTVKDLNLAYQTAAEAYIQAAAQARSQAELEAITAEMDGKIDRNPLGQ